MRFGSVCSGIEAASVAFGPLGWRAAWLAEIESFPSALLAHHYPNVKNLGDMTKIADRIDAGEIEAPDLLCGGTPCQSFSVAGLRQSLSDGRGNLTLEFIRIADAIDRVRRNHGKPPAWVLYENVPGLLSTKDNAFGSFLGGLCGGDAALHAPADGWPSAGVVAGPTRVVAWRVLDAQFFGVPQRRRRIFVLALGGSRAWRCADALLPLADGLQGNPAPRREARQGVAGSIGECADTVRSHPRSLGAIAFASTGETSHPCHPLAAGAHAPAIALNARQDPINGPINGPIDTDGSTSAVMVPGMQVRRLTPRECERLQGFPDDYTAIPHRGKPAADGPRYRALGNSWAVPVVSWVGRRIQLVEELCTSAKRAA